MNTDIAGQLINRLQNLTEEADQEAEKARLKAVTLRETLLCLEDVKYKLEKQK